MSDRSCNYCEDQGDCVRCSYFFEPDKAHNKCGFLWREHTVQPNHPPYSPYAVCPEAYESDRSVVQ